ncbi:MAG: elongation factor Ts [Gemmatimonadota bacterium]
MTGNGQVSMTAVKELRRLSGAGVLACRRALEGSGGDVEAAARLLARRARQETARRAARWTGEGYVAGYLHHTGKLGALVEVGCETDFVARTEEFRTLARQLAEQVAAVPLAGIGAPFKAATDTGEAWPSRSSASSEAALLLAQPWVRDPGMTVGQLVEEAALKLGEAIKVRRFARLDLAEG